MSKYTLLVLLLVSSSCTARQAEITVADVTRVLGTLASDEMRGRDAFSPDAMRAAEFIAAEFEDIGLDYADGLDSYLQTFDVYSVAIQSISAEINGVSVPSGNIAGSLTGPSLEWTSESGPVPVLVAGDDDLIRTWFGIRETGQDAVIVVDPALANQFARIQGFMARGSRTTSMEDGGSIVLLLGAGPVETYSVEATAAVDSFPLANVVGKIPGRRADEFVLFSGHYDHIGIRPVVEGDSIANGANDDASGTTAVIELARWFKGQATPERTLLFAAFTAEESGGFGSRYFSERVDPDQIVAMLNMEMIGKPDTSGTNTAWITGFERSDLGPILSAAVEGTGFEFYADPHPEQDLFFRSDNATLARLGVPAHSISTTPVGVDQDYHKVTDEIETLDLEHMTNTIRGIAVGVESIVSGTATPTRIDPETVRR